MRCEYPSLPRHNDGTGGLVEKIQVPKASRSASFTSRMDNLREKHHGVTSVCRLHERVHSFNRTKYSPWVLLAFSPLPWYVLSFRYFLVHSSCSEYMLGELSKLMEN